MAPRVNRSQVLVLAFLAAAWVALLAILLAAPAIYTAQLPATAPGGGTVMAAVFFALITLLIAAISIGVLRRWRWMFWLVVAAFAAGILRALAAPLELMGLFRTGSPAWYVLLQAAIGVVQFAIAVALLRGYRRSGAWGPF